MHLKRSRRKKNGETYDSWALVESVRTNLQGKSAEELWRTCIGLTQVEDSFRVARHDLRLRPIFHQRQPGSAPAHRESPRESPRHAPGPPRPAPAEPLQKKSKM